MLLLFSTLKDEHDDLDFGNVNQREIKWMDIKLYNYV